MREKKNLRRVTLLVTAQTAYNLDRLAAWAAHFMGRFERQV